MKWSKGAAMLCILTALVVFGAVFMPPRLSEWQDRTLPNVIHREDISNSDSVFVYKLSTVDRIRFLNENNDLYVSLAEPSKEHLSKEQAVGVFQEEITRLAQLKVLPEYGVSLDTHFSATYNTIISKENPQKNISVWTIIVSSVPDSDGVSQLNFYASMDAETGLIYTFTVFGTLAAKNISEPDDIAAGFGTYLGLGRPLGAAMPVDFSSTMKFDDSEAVTFEYEAEEQKLSYYFIWGGEGENGFIRLMPNTPSFALSEFYKIDYIDYYDDGETMTTIKQ